MFRFASLFLILLSAMGSFAQVPASFDLLNYGVRIEPDKRLIVVLSALEMATQRNAAGVEEKVIKTPLSAKGEEFRSQLLKDELLKDSVAQEAELRRKISLFVSQYKRSRPNASDAEIIAPFMSMAYTLTPVPDLNDPVITNDLPGPLLDVLDFAPLVREFYRKSSISTRLDGYVKQYQTDSDAGLRRSAREMVSDLLGYLHTRPRLMYAEKVVTQTQKAGGKGAPIQQVETRENERRFFLVPEKLAARQTINFLNIRDDYYAIVPPDTDLSFSEVRRAFLQFVIDPLVLSNAKELAQVRAWAKPVLDEKRKTNPSISPDVFLAVTRSLVAAADIKQAENARLRVATDIARERIAAYKEDDVVNRKKLSDELAEYKRSLEDESLQQLFEDYEKGAVLAFYFAEQLKGIEDSGFDIAASMRDMLAAFDAAKESNRAASTADARKRAIAAREERRNKPDTRIITAENPVTTKLLEIQKSINAKDFAKANTDLKQLLAANPKEPRIHYNIARVAGLEAVAIQDPEEQAKKLLVAKNAYVEVLRNAGPTTDRALLSLTYVALGRIYEHNNDNAYAIRLYDEAIKLEDVRGGGFSEALAAKQRLLKQ
jgi:hypothetical protein